jgi:hypothetical protein
MDQNSQKETAILPEISLKTLDGLSWQTSGPGKIRTVDALTYKEHEFIVRNQLNTSINMMEYRIRFPEPVIFHRIIEFPSGSVVNCEPGQNEPIGNANEGQGVLAYELSVDKIPAGSRVRIHFTSVRPAQLSGQAQTDLETGYEHQYYLRGQYRFGDIRTVVQFLAPLAWNSADRKIDSLPPETTTTLH